MYNDCSCGQRMNMNYKKDDLQMISYKQIRQKYMSKNFFANNFEVVSQ